MRLDVLIATHNRAASLEHTLGSLLRVPVPPPLDARVIVVANGCTDATPEVTRRYVEQHAGRIRVLSERRRGKSRALNIGIASSDADLIGFVDDDEEVDPAWFAVVLAAFQDPDVDFIGGPYIPRWPGTPPSWLPLEYLGAVGAAESGSEPQRFGSDFPGILKGGNAVIRRSTLIRVGPFAEWLGPSGHSRLLSCEDEEMYKRLIAAGAQGWYLPALRVYHHVDEERLRPGYYRRWCFWRGVSRGLMDRAHPLPVPYVAGVPRFLFGRAARALLRMVKRTVREDPSGTNPLTDELRFWDLAGYAVGRHIYTRASLSPLRSRRALPPGAASDTWNAPKGS